MTPQEKADIKGNFEILFKDSPEYFAINCAKMVQEGDLLRFICFDERGNLKEDAWFPIFNIHRVKRY